MKKPVVTIITATKLSAAQKKQIAEAVEAKLGAAEYKEVVDPGVIGGLKIKLGEQEFDATVAGKLERLETHIPAVTVTTAIELSDAQRKKIKETVSEKLGPVSLTEVVDPTIIGGIKLVAGSRELDATVKGRLEKLKLQFIKTL